MTARHRVSGRYASVNDALRAACGYAPATPPAPAPAAQPAGSPAGLAGAAGFDGGQAGSITGVPRRAEPDFNETIRRAVDAIHGLRDAA